MTPALVLAALVALVLIGFGIRRLTGRQARASSMAGC